jgi:RHS repeat-associated protein
MQKLTLTARFSLGVRALGLVLWTVVGCGGGDGDSTSRGGGAERVGTDRQAATTRPTITPPEPLAPTGLEAITGVGAVETDGSFRYTIPIEVPPGRAGMTPAVSLSYSSSGGNGVLGMGWSLNATSTISRCPPTKASGRDRDTLQFSGLGVRYCLDGERLIRRGLVNEYATEVDSFARIRIVESGASGPTKWTVERKNGRIATYSVLPNTIPPTGSWTVRRTLNANGIDITSETAHVYWPLVEERDRFGNTIVYEYERSNDLADGSAAPLLSKIIYTRCASCGFPNTRDRVVSFQYENRSAADRLEQYTNGVAIKTTKRLFRITTAISDGASATTLRRYNLTYETEGGSRLTKRTLLRGMSMCDAGGSTCTPETRFHWQSRGSYEESQGGYNGFSYEANLDNTNMMETIVFDANGDGNDDVLLFEPSAPAVWQDPNTLPENPVWPVQGVTYAPKVLLGDGGGHFASAVNVNLSTQPFRCWLFQLSRAIPVDLDGNGTTELVVECSNEAVRPSFQHLGTAQYRVLSWQGTPGALTEVNVPGLTGKSVVTEQEFVGVSCVALSSGILRFGDLTGDGLPEMLWGVKDGTWMMQQAQKTAQSPSTAPQVSYAAAIDTKLRAIGPNHNSTRVGGTCQPAMSVSRILDENGDGHAELVQSDMFQTTRSYTHDPYAFQDFHRYRFSDYRNNVTWTWNSGATPVEPTSGSFNWGAAQFLPPQAVLPTGTFGDWIRPWYYLDINGDGLKDGLYLAGEPGWFMRINTGAGYAAPVAVASNARTALDLNTYDPEARWTRMQDHGLQIADMNGDGRDDIVLLASSNNDEPWDSLNLRYRRSLDPIRVLYSNGAGFDAPVTVAGTNRMIWAWKPRPGTPQFAMSALADVNGDGLADVIGMIPGSGTTPKRKLITWSYGSKFPGGVDRMNKVEIPSITEGNGIVEEIGYDNLSLGGVARSLTLTGWDTHTPKVGGDFPRASTARGTVVKKYYSNPRHGKPSSQHFRYYGALRDRQGRGFIGFAESRVLDVLTGVFTHYTFDQRAQTSNSDEGQFHHYLEARRPSVTQEWDAPDASMEPKPDGFFGLSPAAGTVITARHYVSADYTSHPLRMEMQAFTTYHLSAMNGRPPYTSESNSPSESIEFHYDQYGNPVSIEEFYNDRSDPNEYKSYDKNTTIENINDTTAWLISQPRLVTEVTRTKNPYLEELEDGDSGTHTDTRVTELFYKANTGLVEWIVRAPNATPDNPNTPTFEPAGGGLQMTRFLYNAAGAVETINRHSPVGTACNAAPRTGDQICTFATAGAVNQLFDTRSQGISYDSSGSVPEGFTNALGQKRWELYDPKRMWLYATVDENDVKTVITRDTFGRPRKIQCDTGAFEEYGYETSQQYRILRVTRGGGANSVVFFDPHGRPQYDAWRTFSGQSGVSRTSYNWLGEISEQSHKFSSSTFTSTFSRSNAAQAIDGATVTYSASYDTAGRPVSISSAPGVAGTTYAYDAVGTVTETDAVGLRSTTVSDIEGRITKRTQYTANNTAQNTKYRYKGDGALALIIQASGLWERFTYDTIGRPTGWRNVGGDEDGERRWTAGGGYDGFDQLLSETRDGVQTTYTRDKLGRILTRTSAGETQSYFWDPPGGIGHLDRAVNGNHEISFSSFDKGRPGVRRERFIGATPAQTTSLSFGYTYDSLGRLDTLRYPEATGSGDSTAVSRGTFRPGPTIKYSYVNGQISAITEPATNTTIWSVGGRHMLGMVTGARYGASLQASWNYNPSTLKLEGHNTTSGVTSGRPPSQSFVWALNDRLDSRTTDGVLERFTYDGSAGFLDTYHRSKGSTKRVDVNFDYATGGLSAVTTTNWNNSPEWPNVNETSTFKSPAYLHQIDTHTAGGTAQTYTYDASGRVDQVKQGATVKRDFDWNSFNLPSQIRYFGPDTTRTFGYDAFGSRVRKTQNANNEVLYLGKLYEARNLEGNRESVFRIYADADVGVVAELAHPWGSNTRTTRYLFNDHQGSPAWQVVETGNTRVSTELGFFPFGKRKNTTSSQTFSQLGYTGHIQDDDLGLVDMEGRIFDLTTRRFLSRDRVPDRPLTTQGTNPYSYATNDPANFVDPTGFETEDEDDVDSVESSSLYTGEGSFSASGFDIEDLGSGCLCSSPDIEQSSSSDDDGDIGYGDETDDLSSDDESSGPARLPAFVPPGPVAGPAPRPQFGPRVLPRMRPRGGGSPWVIPILILAEVLLDDDDDEIPVYEVSYKRMPHIARNIDRGQNEDGQKFLLHKAPRSMHGPNRKAATGKYGRPPNGWWYDEYPFASTYEGGEDATVDAVPMEEQLMQGADIMWFFSENQVGDGDPFIVTTVP